MTTKENVLEIVREIFMKEKCDTYKDFDLIEVLELLIHRIETEVSEPQVKQLVWNKYGKGYMPDKKCLVQLYSIILSSSGAYKVYVCNGGEAIYSAKNKKEAKTFAQKHFEGLIKSCLERG
ncbi:MAG: hypothetical protein NTW25_00305 [Candidatus Kapabacteria bacterium]|nr:hypothetical protein [Candidatus Kapabacteria bacterium]